MEENQEAERQQAASINEISHRVLLLQRMGFRPSVADLARNEGEVEVYENKLYDLEVRKNALDLVNADWDFLIAGFNEKIRAINQERAGRQQAAIQDKAIAAAVVKDLHTIDDAIRNTQFLINRNLNFFTGVSGQISDLIDTIETRFDIHEEN